jgi:hypothetical protein
MPAFVREKPTPLQNLLLMFNIHALREQWDYFTLANKLPEVIRLYKAEHSDEPTEPELSSLTGLTRGQIRRCRLLFDLPDQYKERLGNELIKPKREQKLSEDVFIEMERALKTVSTRIPRAIPVLNSARDALLLKVEKGVINNITDFRKLAKIATSVGNISISEDVAVAGISQIVDSKNKTGIDEIYNRYFESGYDERKATIAIASLTGFLDQFLSDSRKGEISQQFRSRLADFRDLINKVLED